MSDEENLSKRERQKQRRQQKLQHERAAAAKARRNRTIATVAIIALVLAGIGGLAYGWWTDRQERARDIAEAQERLEELGCGEVQEMPNLGAGHFTGEQLAQSPPEIAYPDRPATSGTHIGQWALTGVYDKVIDERLLIHNLEHGYVNIFYTDDAPAEQVEELKSAAEGWIDDRYPKVIVSRWKAEMPDDARFAYTSWDVRQLCRDFHTGVALNFLENHHYHDSAAPANERTIPPHRDPDQPGAVDPDAVEGDLLFPPLGDDDLPEEGMEELEEAEGVEPADEAEPDPDDQTPEEES